MRLFLFTLFFVSLSAQHFTLLEEAQKLNSTISGQKIGWIHPYAEPNPDPILERASVWISTQQKKTNYLSYLASSDYWQLLQDLGISGVETGPIFEKTAPFPNISCPTNAPVSLSVAPSLGNQKELLFLYQMAEKHRGIVVGQMQAGATGWGKDFWLALQKIEPFPGIYHMIEVEKRDWDLLPKISHKEFIKPLSRQEMEKLVDKGYLVGLVSYAGCGGKDQVKWMATDIIDGIDGKKRRWVYLSWCSFLQPCLNLTDPSFGAQRILSGYLLFLIHKMKNHLVCIDANPFLGIEKTNGKSAWAENHPLTVTAVETISQMARKLGGYSALHLQEPLMELLPFFPYGPEFIYDTQSSIYFFSSLHKQQAKGLTHFYQKIHKESLPLKRLVRELKAPLQMQEKDPLEKLEPSLCQKRKCTKKTLVEKIATSFSLPLNKLSVTDRIKIKRAHLLFSFFYLMQPGIVSIAEEDLMGSYHLHGKECFLYNSVKMQGKDSSSFASQLKAMIKARKIYHLESAKLYKVITSPHRGLFAILLQIFPSEELVMIACNFTNHKIHETFSFRELIDRWAINIIDRQGEKKMLSSSEFSLHLNPLEGKAIHFQTKFE